MGAISVDTSNWLMHYPTLRQVNHCRRQIQAEFGVRLHLNDPDLRNTLAHYAGHSRSRRVQESYAELRMALIELEGPDEPSANPEPGEDQRPKRMYRGRPVAEPEPDNEAVGQSDNGSAEATEAGRARTIMYRGRTLKPD